MTRTDRAELRHKQELAVAMRRDGRSYDEIAEELGYANRGGAWKLLNGALADRVQESATEYLHYELCRLNAIMRAFWGAATEDGDLAAAKVVLQTIDALQAARPVFPSRQVQAGPRCADGPGHDRCRADRGGRRQPADLVAPENSADLGWRRPQCRFVRA